MINLDSNSIIAVVGLGRVGQTVSRYLLRKRMTLYAYDDIQKIFERKEMQLLKTNAKFIVMNKTQSSVNGKKTKLAICSPGLSNNNRTIQYFRQNSTPIIDEVEFTSAQLNHPIIAITGTNGKSTTTTLLGRMLYIDGKNCFWGGNLAPGLPFATTLFQEPKDFYVIEVSSFQLERCVNFHPNIAILLNITQDHLDRHTSLEEYQQIKFRIFRNQNMTDYAIINFEDKVTMENQRLIKSKIIYFSNLRKVKGSYLYNNYIYFNNEKICSLETVKILGTHYINSVLPSVAAAKIIGVKNTSIIETLRAFNGLEHRLEYVTDYEGVIYINNSMCTNPTAGVATLKSFNKPVILIAGGKEKNLEITDYVKTITEKAKYTILIGDNRYRIQKLLSTYHYKNFHLDDSLKDAVTTAKKLASAGDIVLFSPGFASFDLFSNFQERGKVFKEIVYGIK